MSARQEQAAKRRAEMAPLSEFPLHKQCEIAWAVAQDEPPDKWLLFGPPDSARPLAMMQSRAWFEWHWQRGRDPYERRERIPPATRTAVINRDGYVCGLCGGDVEPDDVHLDHIVPWSKGGSDSPSNLQVTHSACNLAKGAKHVGEA